MQIRFVPALLCAGLFVVPSPAHAWGAQGHRIINGAAMRALPANLPAFLRTQSAHDEVALLGPEADRIKGAGFEIGEEAGVIGSDFGSRENALFVRSHLRRDGIGRQLGQCGDRQQAPDQRAPDARHSLQFPRPGPFAD